MDAKYKGFTVLPASVSFITSVITVLQYIPIIVIIDFQALFFLQKMMRECDFYFIYYSSVKIPYGEFLFLVQFY